MQTWAVSEVDKKGKKKKGTLGIGSGAIFFASESDKVCLHSLVLETLLRKLCYRHLFKSGRPLLLNLHGLRNPSMYISKSVVYRQQAYITTRGQRKSRKQ